MIKRSILNIILFCLCTNHAESQEIVIGLQTNRLLKNAALVNTGSKSLTGDTLELPFFDDFSGRSFFPDSAKWSDNYVFINNTYSDNQITAGIATFDALNSTGELYETASSISFEADNLTSQPLNLNYPAGENIRLSFCFQAGGLADLPEENDSLTLQFYAPEEEKWCSVWKNKGNSYPDFRSVIIGIDQDRFLKKGFRFRFINYASLSSNVNDLSLIGNCDQWHIDYVLLDKNRESDDTTYTDVAFTLPLRSLLNEHEAIPWKQYQEIQYQEMGDSITIHYRNNDIIKRNVTRNFEIWDVYNNTLSKSFTAGTINMDPLTAVDSKAGYVYSFESSNTDSALFMIKCWLITDNYDPKVNDTIVYYQHFNNYFAFDDGSAEGGYGVNGLGSNNAMVAYRFKSFIPDTLRGVQICFNDSYMNSNQRLFDLMIWADAGGFPGDVLYSQEEVMVKLADNLNGFHTYVLSVSVPVDDIFYVGWRQRSEAFLNAGLDINTPHNGKQYYWINGDWNISQISGSVMIRPVLGPPLVTSVNDLRYRNDNILHFWPNPANDFIIIDPGDSQKAGLINISIFDLQGRELINVPLRGDRIDISSLREGLYIITAHRNGRPQGYNRLVKTK
jgi:hypothetical protein